MTRLKKQQLDNLAEQGVTFVSKYHKSKDNNMRNQYGISLADYEDMVEEQGGLCIICGEKPEGKRLSVDHCHRTDRVRGLLCNQCNLGLGCFKDNIKSLENAALYLRGFETPNPS